MYSNLYKAGWVVVQEDARVIDTNELVKKRLMKAAAQGYAPEEAAPEGFSSGLHAEKVDALLEDESILRRKEALEEQEALERAIGNAREELARVRAEADQMLNRANVEIESMRARTLEEAKKQGYQAGY